MPFQTPRVTFLRGLPLRITVFLGGLLFIALGCDKRQAIQPEPFDPGQYAYFPLEIGKYVIYQVDSIVYDFLPGGNTSRDSSSSIAKEIVVDTLRDNTNQLIYVLERYERMDAAAPWVFKFTFTSSRSADQAIRTEDNFRFLKLIFPMNRRSEWDGNRWIDKNREIQFAGERMRPFSNWGYEVDSIDVAAMVGSFAFDSTLLVTEADDSNVIERRLSRARYAKHIGLVWREQWILDSQYCNQTPVPADCETRPWEIKAEKGYILRQTVLSFN